MSVREDKVQIRVEIDGQQGINELGKLEMEGQQLRSTMRGLKKDSEEYAAAQAQLATVKDRMVELREEIGLNGLSMRQLRQYQQDVKREWDGAIPDTDKFQELDTQLKAVNDRIQLLAGNLKKSGTDYAQLRQEIGLTGMSFEELGNYQKQLQGELNSMRPNAEGYEALETELRNVGATMDSVKNRSRELAPTMGLLAEQVGISGLNFNELTQYQKELQAAWANAVPQTAEYEHLNQELNQVNAQLALQRDNVNNVPGAYQRLRNEVGLTGLSMDDLTGLQKELQKELNATVATSARFPEISQHLDDVTHHINQQNGMLGKWGQAWQDAKKELFSFGVQSIVAGATTAVVMGIGKMIDKNAELADSLSNIQKTTDMTAEEVGELNSQLGKINTRTASKELREIAAVAGQLGIAKKDIQEFVVATDKLNVALGDEITGGAEEVTRVMGGLRNILTDVKSTKVDQDMLHIGNALNILASQGAATAPVVADLANRIGGVGISMGLSSGQVLGLAATMQELNITAERGGTAVVKLLAHMASAPEKFAKTAGMASAEFSRLVNTDIYAALEKVMQGAAGGGRAATELAGTLGALGEDGASVMEVIAKLGNNIGMLDGKSKTATKALTETASIVGEFDKLNNNFAAKLERVQKALAGFFTMSSLAGPLEGLITWIDKFISKASEMDTLLAGFEQRGAAFTELQSNLSGLASRYDELAKKAVLSTDEQQELKTVIQDITKAVPEAATEWDKYGNTIKVNTGVVNKWVAQQKEALKILNADDIEKATGQIDKVKTTITAYVGQIAALRESIGRTTDQDVANGMKRVLGAIQQDKARAEAELSGYELILARMTGEKTKAQLAQEALDAKAAAAAAAAEEKKRKDALDAMGYLEQIDARIKELREKQGKVKKDNAPEIHQIQLEIEAQEKLRDELIGKFRKARQQKDKQETNKEHEEALAGLNKLFAQLHAAGEKVNVDRLKQDERELQQVEQKYDELEKSAREYSIRIILTAQERARALEAVEAVAALREEALAQKREEQRLRRVEKQRQEVMEETQAAASLAVIKAGAALDSLDPNDESEDGIKERQKRANDLKNAQISQIKTEEQLKLESLERYRQAENLTNEQVAYRKQEIIAGSQAAIDALQNRSREEQRQEDIKTAQKYVAIVGQSMGLAAEAINQFNTKQANKDRKADAAAQKEELKTLDNLLKNKLISEDQYNTRKEELDQKYSDRENQRKREAAQGQRVADVIQATVNGIQGTLTALAQGGPAAATIAGIFAAAQLALLITQPLPEFREGGFTQEEALALPHQNLSRGPGGMLPGGAFYATVNEAGPEYFVPNRLLNDPMVVQHVAAIEAVRTGQAVSKTPAPGFVAGGATSTGKLAPMVATSSTATAPLSEATGQALLAVMTRVDDTLSRLDGTLAAGIHAEVVLEQLARANDQQALIRKDASF